jgi:CzcA family heavy metal efflux pump
MTSILWWAIRTRLLVLAIALGVSCFGVIHLRDAPVDVLPEFSLPYAEVQTEALGLSADEVEQLITVPLEADLLNGVEGVEVIRSKSLPGLSSIVLVFEPGRDVYRERQLIEERLAQAHALPHVSKPPTLLQPLSSSSRVVMVGLSSAELSGVEQSVIAQWVMRPKLLGVPGVANVSIWGMRDQQLQVLVDPERLRRQGITLSQVVASAGNAQVVSPLTFLEASTPGTGGFIETPQQRLQVRHLIEKIADPEALGQVPVAGAGGRLRISDVADIKVDHQPLIGDAVVAGGPGLMLVIEKFPGADTRQVEEGVEDALDTLRPGLAGISMDTGVLNPAGYVEEALDNLGLALLIGAALMLVVLVACRFRWRSIIVALVAVPLSLLVAALVLDLLGQGFNAIAFAGLAAAIAVVVDEAVVATERVMQALRQQPPDAEPTRTWMIVAASAEVRRPLGYATLIVLLVIAPLVVMQGRPGAFFGPAATAYVVGVLAAAVVALTVTPALTSFLTAKWQPGPADGAGHSRLRIGYLSALARVGRNRITALAVAAACALIAVLVLPFTGTSPVPEFEDDDVLVELTGQPGTSDEVMTATATTLSNTLTALPGVADVGAHVGRAITGDSLTNVNSASVWVRIDQDADNGETFEAIEAAVRAVPDVESDVVTYTAKRIRDVGALTTGDNAARGDGLDVLTGADQPLAVRVYGEDLAVLRAQAARVQEVMGDVDGVVDAQVEAPGTEPTIEIEVDLEKAQAFGLTPGHVRRAEATLLQGIQVGSVFEEQKVFDVIVRGTPATRSGVQSVRRMLIDTPQGGHVRLDQVADVRVVPSPSVVDREAVSRYVDVQAGVEGRSVGAVAADIEDRLTQMEFPIEYHAEVLTGGTSEEIGRPWVLGTAVGAAIAVFLLLQALFGSWRLAVLVFVTLPLSLVGGLLSGLLDGLDLSLGSMLGFLAVFGLATRLNLVLVARIRALETEMPGSDRADTVRQVASERLAPVTVSVLALAALVAPFAFLGSQPGLEIMRPMALVILGGVVSSALMTLLVLPALYLHLAPPVRYDVSEMDADYEMPVNAETDHEDSYRDRRAAPDRETST